MNTVAPWSNSKMVPVLSSHVVQAPVVYTRPQRLVLLFHKKLAAAGSRQ